MFNKLNTIFKRPAKSNAETEIENSASALVQEGEKIKTGKSSTNKGSMIIRVVIILGIAYYGLTEFVFKEEPPPPPPPVVKNKRPKKIKKDQPKVVVTDKPSEEKIKDPVKNVQSSDTEKISQPPIENINIAEKTIEPDIKKVANKDQSVGDNSTNETVNTTEKTGEKTVEKSIDKQIDLLIDKENSKDTKSEQKIDLKDKIMVEDSYVEPPTYEESGRGLVYNCKEKFWVCVDKPSYINCNKNMKFNKSHTKKSECATVNVYNTVEDCRLIQKYNVSINKETPFCD